MLNSNNEDVKIKQKIVNQAIDELIDEDPRNVYVSFGRRYIPNNVRWAMIFQNFFLQKAKDHRLHKSDRMVLDYLIGSTDFENYVMVSQNEIAEGTGLKRQNVGRSLKNLIKHGYIDIRKAGRNNVYRLTPEMVWKGKYKKRAENIVEFPAH